ncbi:MAG: (2Fe-2S) ferredoxin domain-containing protein [Cyanobacteria bacterium]|nr:(2Fe-2S) ferredoxin domain-containing protein [Cyanobacteriota bacterium]
MTSEIQPQGPMPSPENIESLKEGLKTLAPVTQAPLKRHLFVCTGSSCSANGSQETLETFWKVMAEKGLLYGKRGSLTGEVIVTTCGSVGLCAVGPAVLIYPEGIWYQRVTPEDVPEIVESHLIHNKPVSRLLAKNFKPHP